MLELHAHGQELDGESKSSGADELSLLLHQELQVHLVESLHVVVLELFHELVNDCLLFYFIVLLVLTSTSIKKLIIISESFITNKITLRFIKFTYFEYSLRDILEHIPLSFHQSCLSKISIWSALSVG